MLGPVVVDVEGTRLSEVDRRRLLHPRVGMVILFARNCESAGQLRELTDDIHGLRSPPLLIAVDHEGGRVQRFRQPPFTRIPAMARLGRLWDEDVLRAHPRGNRGNRGRLRDGGGTARPRRRPHLRAGAGPRLGAKWRDRRPRVAPGCAGRDGARRRSPEHEGPR